MSDTGGGHRASAEAIAEALEHLYPGRFETIIEDVWKKSTPFPFNRLPNTYGWLTGPGLPLWKTMWYSATHGRVQDWLFKSVNQLVRKQCIPYLRRKNPALVISVHPLMNHLGVAWMRAAGLGHVPFMTVVTDMVTFHPSWLCPDVDRCLVPTAEAYDRAVELGMPREKLAVCGQPVKLKFLHLSTDKAQVRRELGLDEAKRTVLLIGGGEGYGRLYHIARHVATAVAGTGIQLLIVTGRNQRLRRRLENVAWEIPTHIYGFVHNMPQMMSAADMLITKAGPGTLSEAFIAGLPPIICGHIPGQEVGNVTYVQEHGAGAYAEDPSEIAALVRAWVDPSNPTLQQMAKQAARLARPRAALDIAQEVHDLLSPPVPEGSPSSLVVRDTAVVSDPIPY